MQAQLIAGIAVNLVRIFLVYVLCDSAMHGVHTNYDPSFSASNQLVRLPRDSTVLCDLFLCLCYV